jgi:hypothetical protein
MQLSKSTKNRPLDKIVHREIELPGELPAFQVFQGASHHLPSCAHALNIENHTSESSHIITLSYILTFQVGSTMWPRYDEIRKGSRFICSRWLHRRNMQVYSLLATWICNWSCIYLLRNMSRSVIYGQRSSWWSWCKRVIQISTSAWNKSIWPFGLRGCILTHALGFVNWGHRGNMTFLTWFKEQVQCFASEKRICLRDYG